MKAVLVLALYILIQQLEQYLLVPAVMAKQLSLAPAITLLSQIVFALFFGFLGLLLALPLLVIGQIWVKEVLVKDILDRWNHSPLTRTPVLASEGVAIPNDLQGSMTSDLPTVTPPKEESS